MGMMFSVLTVLALLAAVFLGVGLAGLDYFFGIVIPYLALAVFIGGFSWRILRWAKAPVPFRIPTTCGQQKSLSWIKAAPLDNPHTAAGVIGRMALEVLLFRSLFRNTKAELTEEKKLAYHWEKWLWLAGLAFHWSFLIIIIRHLRFFFEPVPGFLYTVQALDGFFQVSLQAVYVTGFLLLAAVTYLFIRRVVIPEVKYISLASDYLPLFIIMAIAGTGLVMRYFVRVDVIAAKALIMGLVSFQPTVPPGIGWLFYLHLFLASFLLAYFPFSKLMHMGGIFLSPTRNLANNNRAVRHVNPWDHPVPVHTYEEYVEEFKEKMKDAGLPL